MKLLEKRKEYVFKPSGSLDMDNIENFIDEGF